MGLTRAGGAISAITKKVSTAATWEGVFTAPDGSTTSEVLQFWIANPTTTPALVSAGLVRDGTSNIANGVKWFENIPLPAHDTLVVPTPIMLNVGDEILAKSSIAGLHYFVNLAL